MGKIFKLVFYTVLFGSSVIVANDNLDAPALDDSYASSTLTNIRNGGDVYSISMLRSVPYTISEISKMNQVGVGGLHDKSHHIYSAGHVVKIKLDKGISVLPGQKYEIVNMVKNFVNGNRGAVVIPVGAGFIKDVDGQYASLEINEVWGVIKPGDRISKYRDINFTFGLDSVILADSITANLAYRPSKSVIFYPNEPIVISCGKSEGISFGDIFDVFEIRKDGVRKYYPSMKAVAVLVNEHYTTVITKKVSKRVDAKNERKLPGQFKFVRRARLIFK